MNRSSCKTIDERVEEAFREVGVLLIAFTPLDVALNRHSTGNLACLFLFLGLGIVLFDAALILERNRDKGSPGPWLLIFLLFGVLLMVAALTRGFET